MSERKSLSLPGDAVLPVSLLIETYTRRELTPMEVEPEAALDQLSTALERTALEQMSAGEILRRKQYLEQSGAYRLRATYECSEMIAKTVEANWIEEDYEHD